MNAVFRHLIKIIAYGDSAANDNPQRRFVDWTHEQSGLIVENPTSRGYAVDPSATLSIFNGVRTTLTDATSQFSLEENVANRGIYRLTWTSGTNPVFRTDRNLALSGSTVTTTVNSNGSVTMQIDVGSFAGVAPGDTLFIPGQLTGDSASPFNFLNVGFWQVMAVQSTTQIQLTRLAGEVFTGVSESVTLTSDAQLIAFSADGVQPGDKLAISAGFAIGTQKTYELQRVTSTWIEFASTSPLATETGILPDATGLQFYTSSKRFVHIEADQECVVRMNGDTGDYQRLSPSTAADPASVAYLTKIGPTWSMEVVNKSTQTLNLTVISTE